MATAIFYASSTGNTSDVANDIAKNLGDIETFDIANGIEQIKDFDKVILGSSTWGEGELQDDWEESWDDFSDIDFSGKTVALFGLGDQDGYGDNFVDAMGLIYEKVKENGAKVVGSWDVSEEYYHDESHAIRDGKFVGLALDEDNQDDLTSDRVNSWCEQIKDDIL